MKCHGGTALLDKGFPPEMGRMVPPLLLSLQGVHQFSSLPTFPSAAMQCQRWLQAQALAQSLTLPQSSGSGEQHENTWPLSRAAAVCLPAPGEPEGLELQGAWKFFSSVWPWCYCWAKWERAKVKARLQSVSPVGVVGKKNPLQNNPQNKQIIKKKSLQFFS